VVDGPGSASLSGSSAASCNRIFEAFLEANPRLCQCCFALALLLAFCRSSLLLGLTILGSKALLCLFKMVKTVNLVNSERRNATAVSQCACFGIFSQETTFLSLNIPKSTVFPKRVVGVTASLATTPSSPLKKTVCEMLLVYTKIIFQTGCDFYKLSMSQTAYFKETV